MGRPFPKSRKGVASLLYVYGGGEKEGLDDQSRELRKQGICLIQPRGGGLNPKRKECHWDGEKSAIRGEGGKEKIWLQGEDKASIST